MDLYVHLTYKQYKALEKAMTEFKETTHKTVTGFYHKSIRIPVGDSEFEFHGPAPKAMEPLTEERPLDRRKGERRVTVIQTQHVRRRSFSDRRKKPQLSESPVG